MASPLAVGSILQSRFVGVGIRCEPALYGVEGRGRNALQTAVTAYLPPDAEAQVLRIEHFTFISSDQRMERVGTTARIQSTALDQIADVLGGGGIYEGRPIRIRSNVYGANEQCLFSLMRDDEEWGRFRLWSHDPAADAGSRARCVASPFRIGFRIVFTALDDPMQFRAVEPSALRLLALGAAFVHPRLNDFSDHEAYWCQVDNPWRYDARSPESTPSPDIHVEVDSGGLYVFIGIDTSDCHHFPLVWTSLFEQEFAVEQAEMLTGYLLAALS